MKHKSLRQLARELGVSASYLSQVNHGKKRLSERLHKVLTSVNQLGPSSTQDLNTKPAGHTDNPKVVGSNPTPATNFVAKNASNSGDSFYIYNVTLAQVIS